MRISDFTEVVRKIARFKMRLEQENVIGKHQQIILKIYINDLTSRINTSMLRVI